MLRAGVQSRVAEFGMNSASTKDIAHVSENSAVAGRTDDQSVCSETVHLSMLETLVHAAEDIDAGRVYGWDEFKLRLSILRIKAKSIAGE